MLGDLTNKADLAGLNKGWDITKKIGQLLKVGCVIPNVGNHDVDSRKKLSSDPFRDIKSFATDFPFQDVAQKEQFWRDGFIIREEEHFRVLVINTVHSHTDADEAFHGLVSQEAINQIEESLNLIKDNKLNIAICHHNPIEHSHYATGSKDFMYNGDELLSILDRYNFDLVIHGHKHDARIRYAPGGSNPPVVFSSGSFSAYSSLLLQGAYNTFHIITFDISESRLGRGIIETWVVSNLKAGSRASKVNFSSQLLDLVQGWIYMRLPMQ